MSNQAFPTSNGTNGIDVSRLEKRLEGLRDTQESVQGLSLWCQSNRRHSTAITETWLRVLRKSPVEKRLTMFYLANDVVQHAKRKGDSVVVNQWALVVQKATPHVRSPSSVSSAITRIFKIWEERGIYSKEAITDLLFLLNNVSSKERVDDNKNPETYTANAEKVAAFQPSTLISKFKSAARLKPHIGTTFRTKSYCQMDMNTLKNSIKDRQHGQEVIQEMGALLEQLRTAEQKLQAEVDERRAIVESTEIAIVFYENVRSESEIVNSAYKSFTARIMKAKEAVDSKLKSFEDMEREPSPCPSPPAAAPSPPSEDDDEYVPRIVTSGDMQSTQILGFNHVVESSIKPSTSVSSSLDAVISAFQQQDARNNAVTTSTTIPTVANSAVVTNSMVTSTIMPNPHMAYNNTLQMPTAAYDTQLGLQQQHLQSWPPMNDNFASMMMNFQQNNNAMAFPPQNFTMPPPMHIPSHLNMQQQMPFGYPPPNPAMNYHDITDVSSIPLPPQNPPPSGGQQLPPQPPKT